MSASVVNFALIYTLETQPGGEDAGTLDADPRQCAQAITASPTGQVPFSDYQSSFPG